MTIEIESVGADGEFDFLVRWSDRNHVSCEERIALRYNDPCNKDQLFLFVGSKLAARATTGNRIHPHEDINIERSY